jgi:hypothetical protein
MTLNYGFVVICLMVGTFVASWADADAVNVAEWEPTVRDPTLSPPHSPTRP